MSYTKIIGIAHSYKSSNCKNCVCIDCKTNNNDNSLCGSWLRYGPEGLEILPIGNGKKHIKVIGVDEI